MKEERLLDILMYLFKIYTDNQALMYKDFQAISQEMIQAGFHPQEVDEVINWLNELKEISTTIESKTSTTKNFHVYTKEECMKFHIEARNYLLYLERMNIIDVKTRELIIDRAMALDLNVIKVSDIKWITFMILFKNPDCQQQQQLLAVLLLSNDEQTKHQN